MANAEVILKCKTCGKTFTKSAVKHNRREADEWEAWAAANITECPECYAARKKAEITDVKCAAFGHNLAELTGSEKQVKWANDIRNRILSEIINTFKNPTEDFWKIVNEKLTDSRFWIDNRDATVAEISHKMYELR